MQKKFNREVYMFSLDPADAVERAKSCEWNLNERFYKERIKAASNPILEEFTCKMEALVNGLEKNQTGTWHGVFAEFYWLRDAVHKPQVDKVLAEVERKYPSV